MQGCRGVILDTTGSMYRRTLTARVLVALVLVALCGFLTTRAHYALKNTEIAEEITSRRLVFGCGYPLQLLSAKVFPDYEFVTADHDTLGTPQDILLIGMHGGCTIAKQFTGRVVYVNGEAEVEEMVNGSFYLGPLSVQRRRALQFYYVSYAALAIQNVQESLLRRNQSEGDKFLLYISSRCFPHRERAFDNLSQLGEVAAGGRCRGNTATNVYQESVAGSWCSESVQAIYRKYKFGLVMENSNVTGYVSEKLLQAFHGGVIPIYYGPEDVFKIFNKDALIFYTEIHQDEVIAQVARLLHDPDAYNRKASLPFLVEGALESYFWKGRVQINKIRQHIGDAPLK